MRCRAHYLLIAVSSVLGMGQMIAACGQKRDLYLSEPEPAQQTTAGTETKTTQQTKASGKTMAEAGSRSDF